MLDFKRIGGEILSAPLNENFRKLQNEISISNTNLVFPDKNAVVGTIEEMKAIADPVNAQTCYVVSSGELFRYSGENGTWLKIADFGATFRQSFLNSGAVVLGEDVKLAVGSKIKLQMPDMLIYFKNKEGDKRYLRGMYLVNSQVLDITPFFGGANSYSIYIDSDLQYSVSAGLPKEDNPNNIYIATIVINSKKEILPHFIYTVPDVAYTADRGEFILHKGQASGLNLMPSDKNNNTVNRQEGFYYDEGINITKGDTQNYPNNTDNGANFNLKYFAQVYPVKKLVYMMPKNALNSPIQESTGLIGNKYYSNGQLVTVKEGHFTIQQHLTTPNGQDIIIYGSKEYNSLTDAVSNINQVEGLDFNFPSVETTRIVVGSFAKGLNTADPKQCAFFTMDKLSQVGTISPEFADSAFKIYSGKQTDTTPAQIRFSLSELDKEDYNQLFSLTAAPSKAIRKKFALDKKYITKNDIKNIETTIQEMRSFNGPGYLLADNADLNYLESRVADIETEIWQNSASSVLTQKSVRQRLESAEEAIKKANEAIQGNDTDIASLQNNKVNKTTKINGYTLGDNQSPSEAKSVVIKTGDIAEGVGLTSKTNYWYTEDRVNKNASVAASETHRKTVSQNGAAAGHVKINPHNISTDDLNILTNSDKVFVTRAEKARISADKLPDDTKSELAALKTTAADSMKKSIYAKQSISDPVNLAGYVDKSTLATTAQEIQGVDILQGDKYYGSLGGRPGFHEVKKYVSSADKEQITIDDVILVPANHSIGENHLTTELANKINNNYHKIYNSGTLSSNEINEFNFGNNLTVTVAGHKATINATGAGSSGVTKFSNLDDVDVVYSGNKGKVLVVNEAGNGVTVSDNFNLHNFMLKTAYVDPNNNANVKTATNALQLNGKVVNNSKIDSQSLWTADQIVLNTTEQIAATGVRTYSGSAAPSNTLGKDGDIYILIK